MLMHWLLSVTVVTQVYTECSRRSLPYFGSTFPRLIYIYIIKHTYIWSSTIVENQSTQQNQQMYVNCIHHVLFISDMLQLLSRSSSG